MEHITGEPSEALSAHSKQKLNKQSFGSVA